MGFLDGSNPTPAATIGEGLHLLPNPDFKQWCTMDNMLLSLIYASLTEECMAEVVNSSSAHAAWLALEASFSHSSKS